MPKWVYFSVGMLSVAEVFYLMNELLRMLPASGIVEHSSMGVGFVGIGLGALGFSVISGIGFYLSSR